jgi:hypothetical protein
MELNIEYQLLQQTNTTTNKCNKQTNTHIHISFCRHIRILQTKETIERKYKLILQNNNFGLELIKLKMTNVTEINKEVTKGK